MILAAIDSLRPSVEIAVSKTTNVAFARGRSDPGSRVHVVVLEKTMKDELSASDSLLRKLQDCVDHWERMMLAKPGDKVFELRWKEASKARDNVLEAKKRAGTA